MDDSTSVMDDVTITIGAGNFRKHQQKETPFQEVYKRFFSYFSIIVNVWSGVENSKASLKITRLDTSPLNIREDLVRKLHGRNGQNHPKGIR